MLRSMAFFQRNSSYIFGSHWGCVLVGVSCVGRRVVCGRVACAFDCEANCEIYKMLTSLGKSDSAH